VKLFRRLYEVALVKTYLMLLICLGMTMFLLQSYQTNPKF